MHEPQEDESTSSIRRWSANSADATDLPIIEGEYVSEVAPPSDQPMHPAPSSAQSDVKTVSVKQDPALVLSVLNTELTVNPGATVTLRIQMLNNGDRAANFELLIEGWINPAWVADNPIHQALLPGEQAIVQTEISPPRTPQSPAGEHSLVLVLRSTDYPQRESRQRVILNILPYDEIVVNDITPRTVQSSWKNRTADFNTVVMNQSNHPVQVRLQGEGDRSTCFLAQVDDELSLQLQHLADTSHMQGEVLVQLEGGERQAIQGTVCPDRLPLLRTQSSSIRLSASLVGKQLVPRTTSAKLRVHPLLSPRQITLATLLLIFVLFAITALGATGIGLVQLVDSLPQAAVEADLAATQNQAPAYAIVLPVDEAVPARQTSPSLDENRSEAPAADNSQPALAPAPELGREAAVPLVEANQVSAPGAAAPPPSTGATPVPSPTRAELTYAQMFQEIGLRFDLDWRMLAAQAYVESKFDTLALGSDGDLGLMQVLPGTWQEWAPVVDVNDPFDAYSNALVAAVYLDYLRTILGQRGHPEVEWMLVAYNWGPDKVNRFLADGNTWENLPDNLQQYANEIVRIAQSLPE